MGESWLGIIYGGNKKQNFLKTRLVSEFVRMPYIINDDDIIGWLEYGPDYQYPILSYNTEPLSQDDDQRLLQLILKIGPNFEPKVAKKTH